MMTGYADQRERADGLDEIVIDVVAKPFSLGEIRKQVDLALAA
jgi:DNA-binding response OmpR family regulator